jgi:putative transposase
MYCVRRLKLGISEQLERLALATGELYSKTLVSFWQLERLALATGELYSKTLVSFWRVVRKKGLWLKPASLMRWFPNNGANELHSHSADAVVQSFFASLQSWRRRRQADPNAKPPRRRRRYFKVIKKTGFKPRPLGRLLLEYKSRSTHL